MQETYSISITTTISEEQLQNGLFIFMFRASRIPPHLGIITNGKLYDISTVGPNIGITVVDFYKTVLKRKTETVFIELEKPKSNLLVAVIEEQVKKYWKVTKEVSCLSPIKDFIEEIYSFKEAQEASFIFDLLPILQEQNLIKDISEINLSNKLINNALVLNKYTQKDIENCINALTRKEQQAC
jgi:hypothetical protein